MDEREALRKKLLKKARDQIKEKFAGKEIHIIKAVRLLSDLDSINNLMKENASEWKLRSPTGEAKSAFEELEKNTQGIEEERKRLMEFIEKEMKAEFPNFSVLATPVLGAKLLASAGSKKRLCFMPASTIQVLGAEKALFAHMRKKAKSPKHGHLFNHPLMQKLPRFRRGKVARIIAGKLSIALKQDYFKGEDTSAKVMKELEAKINKIASEPITPRQEKQEQMLIEQHESKPKPAATEHRTFTPEERREYFRKKNLSEQRTQGHQQPRQFRGPYRPEGRQDDRSYGRNETKSRDFGKGRFNKPRHMQKKR